MYFHKFFKVNGELKGIPTFYMYCNLYQKENVAKESQTYERFDWVKVVGRSNGIYLHLCCLIELVSYTNEIRSSQLLYLGIETIDIPNSRRAQIRSVFPEIKYRSNRNYQLYGICDLVNSILEPACVIPVSNSIDAYFETDPRRRSEIIYNCIPFGYIFRDDWGETSHNSFEEMKRNIHSSNNVREYLAASKEQKLNIFQRLQSTLLRNDNENATDNEELLGDVLERMRYCVKL